MNLTDLATRLAGLDLDAAAGVALASEAHRIADAVREALSHEADDIHDYPAKRTGTLLQSIGVTLDVQEAVVGAADPVALWQEHGTATIPPRPFLAPVAGQHGQATAQAIGQAVATALGRM